MPDPDIERVLWLWLIPELLLLCYLLAVVGSSLLGYQTVASPYSRTLRVAAMAFLLVELAIPTWIYADIRRRPNGTSTIWVHAAMLPIVNLFGLLGYLEERRRSG